MKPKVLLPLFTILCLLMTGCGKSGSSPVIIQGEVEHMGQSLLLVSYNNARGELTHDTVETTAPGKFSLKLLTSDGLTPITIQFSKNNQWTTLFAEPGDKITIRGDLNTTDLLEIKGGAVNDDLMLFKNLIRSLYLERLNILSSAYATDRASLIRLAEINLALKRSAKDFILEHPTSIASVVLIQDFFYQDYDPATAELLGILRGNASLCALAEKMRSGMQKW